MTCCGSTAEIATDGSAMAYAPLNDLKRALPKIKEILGTNDIEILQEYRFTYMVNPKLRDRAIARFNVDIEPLINRSLHSLWDNTTGFILYETRSEPTIKYIICNYFYATGYRFQCVIVPKGQVFGYWRHVNRSNKANSEKQPPLLEDGLLDEIINNTIDFLCNKKKIEAYGVKIKRGILLQGLPGNGKTMLCRWIKKLCSDHGVDCNTVTGQEILAAFSEGQPLDNLFCSSPVIFFDDIDISFLNRSQRGDIACAILSAMDGINQSSHNIRIFTTNESVKDLDPAFVRPGRIDRSFTIKPPNEELRRRFILERWPQEIKDYLTEEESRINKLVKQEMSFADMDCVKSLLVTNKLFSEDEKWNLTKALTDFYNGRILEQKKGFGF